MNAVAPAYVTVEELKRHLNIDADFTADDTLLQAYASAAEGAVAADLDLPDLGALVAECGELPQPVRLAVMMLTAHFYASREPVVYGVSVASVPLSVEYLVAPYRRFNADGRTAVKPGYEYLTGPASDKDA